MSYFLSSPGYVYNTSSSNAPIMCSKCLIEIDEYDSNVYYLHGAFICGECIEQCECCGDFIDDNSPSALGPSVRYRQYEVNGKLSGPEHAVCAAESIICDMADSFAAPFSLGGIYTDACTDTQIALLIGAKVIARGTR